MASALLKRIGFEPMSESSQPKTSGLDAYRAKRSAASTPEPSGDAGGGRPGLFVVQKHAARRLHYDLRIEVDGVLWSWAVPKGPSLANADKRFAVETENHPVEYADFEGLLPEGSYGAAAMSVWDRGRCVARTDHPEGYEKGKLLFELEGYKLRGLWTLVKTKKPKEWLLIKERDAWARGETVDELPPESVFSGLTVEELAGGHNRAAEVRAELEALGAPRRRVESRRVKPMLAEACPRPFSKPGWLFELKYDGFRLLAERRGGTGSGGHSRVELRFRSGQTTAAFPEVSRALAALPYESLVTDGEVVVLDELAKPSFQRLQRRGLLTRAIDIERAAVELPATYFVFDLLGFAGFDLRPLPLAARKAILRRLLPKAGPLRYADHVEERGEAVFAEVRRLGLEGAMAKQASAPYRGGRSPAWLKLRASRGGDFVVVGYSPPKGSRAGLGALHLAALEGPRMTYAGRVGSGFSVAQLEELHQRLEPLRRDDPPFYGQAPRRPADSWVEPRLVAEVRYTEVGASGHLRHPVFVRLRHDKRPEECVREDLPRRSDEPAAAPLPPPAPRPKVAFSRLEKVFWPADGFTKGDLVGYYRAVSRWLLPYLEDRPVVLDRYPDGIEGKSFYQKHAPDFVPDWIRTAPIWSGAEGKETHYIFCDDEASLLYLANLGTIPLHVWSSRLATLQAPDWCILDLDAKEAPFAAAVAVARAIRELCERIELECFVKTSGATGLHVLLPLGGACTYEQSRQLAEVLAKVIVQQQPEIASVSRLPAARQGKVYVDFLQNGYGKLLAAPFSARPRPGATVSTPLAWSEVDAKLDPGDFTLRTVPERLESAGEDPLRRVFDVRPDLPAVLGRLAELL